MKSLDASTPSLFLFRCSASLKNRAQIKFQWWKKWEEKDFHVYSEEERRGELVSFDKETSINRKRNTTRRSRSRSAISIGRAVDMYRLSLARHECYTHARTHIHTNTRIHICTRWPSIDRVTRICRGLKNSSLESGRIDATVADGRN